MSELWRESLRTIQQSFSDLHSRCPDLYGYVADFPWLRAGGCSVPEHLDPPPVLLGTLLPGRVWDLPRVGRRTFRHGDRIGILHLHGERDGLARFMEISASMPGIFVGIPGPVKASLGGELNSRVYNDLTWPRSLFDWACRALVAWPVRVSRWSVDAGDGKSRVAYDPETCDHFYTRAINLTQASVHGVNLLLAAGAQADGSPGQWEMTLKEATDLHHREDFPYKKRSSLYQRIRRACIKGDIETNGKEGSALRIDPGSFAQWRIEQRNADLDNAD